eukprot:gene8039-8234_t
MSTARGSTAAVSLPLQVALGESAATAAVKGTAGRAAADGVGSALQQAVQEGSVDLIMVMKGHPSASKVKLQLDLERLRLAR